MYKINYEIYYTDVIDGDTGEIMYEGTSTTDCELWIAKQSQVES